MSILPGRRTRGRELSTRPVKRLREPVGGRRTELEYGSAGRFERAAGLRGPGMRGRVSGRADCAGFRCRGYGLRVVERRQRTRRGRTHITSRLPRRAGQAGRQRQTFRPRMTRWNTVSRRLPRARLATCASRGWTRANHPLWNVFQRSSSNGGADLVGRRSQLSGGARGFDRTTIMSGPMGFRFPFGDYFSIAIDNLGNTHVVWGEGRNYKSPGSIWYTHGR